MERKDKNNREYYTIDLSHIAKALGRRLWLIGVCGVIAAVIGFVLSAFIIAPTYSSYIKLYVNNSSFSVGSFCPTSRSFEMIYVFSCSTACWTTETLSIACILYIAPHVGLLGWNYITIRTVNCQTI